MLETPLILPINYHHILQAVIYAGIDDGKGLSTLYHEYGAMYEKRKYKMFSFGTIHGKYTVRDKEIIFYEQIDFEVRALDEYFLFQLQKNLLKRGITFGNQTLHSIQAQLTNEEIESEYVRISMDSPICVYMTEENGFTRYFEPGDEEFQIAVNDNFVRKYFAAYGEMPESSVIIEPVKVSPRDKYITRYKDIYICGWKGIYQLTGDTEYLNFLYSFIEIKQFSL